MVVVSFKLLIFLPQGNKGEPGPPGLPGKQVLVTPEVNYGHFLENDQENHSRTILTLILFKLMQGATLDDIRQAFPIPMGPPGATVSHMFTF